MVKILIVEQGVIDRKVMETILSDKMGNEADVQTADSMECAGEELREEEYDLLLVSASFQASYVNELIEKVRYKDEGTGIILTSVKGEAEVAQLSDRLHVNRYLLKPFTEQELLKVVGQELSTVKLGEKQTEQKVRSRYIKEIEGYIQNCQYKECVEAAKRYLKFLYDNTENTGVLREKIIEFSTELVHSVHVQSEETRAYLQNQNARIKGRFDFRSNPFMVTSIIGDMLSLIFEDMDAGERHQEDIMKRALNYIDRNITKKISLETVAEHINLSPTYFSKFFKKSTGTNFITYVTERKMEYAKEMLRNTNIPVANIAHELAYTETNYFCKTFKKKSGVTPTEYRETNAGTR